MFIKRELITLTRKSISFPVLCGSAEWMSADERIGRTPERHFCELKQGIYNYNTIPPTLYPYTLSKQIIRKEGKKRTKNLRSRSLTPIAPTVSCREVWSQKSVWHMAGFLLV